MSWMGLRRALQEHIIVIEEVPQFPDKVVEEMLGDIYVIQRLDMSPTEFGFPPRLGRHWRAFGGGP
eukprot:8449472-Alexandrium_andersonii.AAC.1